MYKRTRKTSEPGDGSLEGYHVYPGPVIQQPNQTFDPQLSNPPYWSATMPHGISQATWQHPPGPNPPQIPNFDEKARDSFRMTMPPSFNEPVAKPTAIADTLWGANVSSKVPSEKTLVRGNTTLPLPVTAERITSFPIATQHFQTDSSAPLPPPTIAGSEYASVSHNTDCLGSRNLDGLRQADALGVSNEGLTRENGGFSSSNGLDEQLQAELQNEKSCTEDQVLPRYTSGDAMGLSFPYQRISLKQDESYIGRKTQGYEPPPTVGRPKRSPRE